MTGAKVRIWMINKGLKPKDLSDGYDCKPSFITDFLKGDKTSQPLVDYLIAEGCPKENFKDGRVATEIKKGTESLKFMANEIQPVSGKEISEALKEPHGTIMCHLVTLEEGGFVRKVYERYELGLYLATIRTSVKRSRELMIDRASRDLGQINEELEG